MKITVIGGAGIRTVNFIGGLLDRCEELDIQEVALYDIDREKLEIIGLLCRYVAERRVSPGQQRAGAAGGAQGGGLCCRCHPGWRGPLPRAG